jgi:uncharacterized protein YcnI
MKRLLQTLLAAVAAILLATIAFTAPASAHVEATAMPQGALTMVSLNVEHGCGELDLTGLRVQLPEGATQVAATDQPGWTSNVSETEISWSGGPQPAHEAIDFQFALKLAQTEGETVLFPTIELCPGAELAWIEVTPEGGPEPEHPVPQITVGKTGSMDHMATSESTGETTSTTKAASTATMAPEQTPITQEGSTTHNAGLVVLLVVMAIIIGGAVVLYLRNRKPAAKN